MSAEDQILKLFSTHNKPFNLQQIVDWLAQYGIKKAQISKAMDALVESNKLVAKDFGKTRIWIPPQAGLKLLSKEEVDAKKNRIDSLREQLKTELTTMKELEQELAEWKSSMTEEQIDSKTEDLSKQWSSLEQKLAAFRKGTVLVTKEEKAQVEKVLLLTMDAWRKRRGVFRNIWNAVSENLEGKQSDLFEEMGVETDESIGVNLSEIESLMPKRRRY